MSADLLREAAAKMRERAEAATPGPWQVHADDAYQVGYARRDGEFDEQPMARVTGYGGTVYPWDAEHIASWHPAVALAVANLLDGSADRWDAGDLGPEEWDELAAVARAYLGADQ